MNQEILDFIAQKSKEAGLTQHPCSYLLFADKYIAVDVYESECKGLFFFQIRSFELSNEVTFKFPIPETLEEFMQIAKALKLKTLGYK